MSFLLHKYAATNRDHFFAGLSPLQDSEASVFTVQGTYLGHYNGGISFFNGPGPVITTVLPSSQMHVDETYFALMQIDYSTTDTDSVMVKIYDGLSAEVANPTFSNLNLDNSMGRFGVLTQNFGTRPGLDEFRFGTELSDVMVMEGDPCDFNNDGNCNITDLNLMLAEGPIAPGVAVTPGVNDHFDLNGDGWIDLDDQSQWLADAATINVLGSPYKPGDANLDGVVDGSDFGIWNANKFTSTLLWDTGNFDGNAVTDGSDCGLWNANKFTSSDGASAIPEPGMGVFLITAMIGLAVVRGR